MSAKSRYKADYKAFYRGNWFCYQCTRSGDGDAIRKFATNTSVDGRFLQSPNRRIARRIRATRHDSTNRPPRPLQHFRSPFLPPFLPGSLPLSFFSPPSLFCSFPNSALLTYARANVRTHIHVPAKVYSPEFTPPLPPLPTIPSLGIAWCGMK